MKISDILDEKSVLVQLEASSKSELLEKMMGLAMNSGRISDKSAAFKEVLEREKIMSTGVGKGIALPHAKTNVVDGSVGALGILKKSVDFNSLDSKPVNIVFLLLGKESNVGNHLRLLSKISRLMNNNEFRESLEKKNNAREVLQLISEFED